ncbi:MAG TPA: aldo/keto reductase [candidate division Zixibacteria bacterium]|nr:aldo/keto reductase [candidate division Zixibacteria bacterium]
MQYRTLGKTGLRVSVIGLGTMVHAGHFGPMDDAESLAAIDTALELGVNFIDTSDAYGAGYGETLLGKALKGRRDKVVIATKGGNVMTGPNRGKRNFAPDYIAGVLEGSLRRLQTDYIDLYQLHNPTVEVIERGEVWEVLERAKKAGKILHYGVSINTMEEGIAAVKDGRAETIQIEYSLLAQEPAEQVLPLAREANVGVIARVPLRRGVLTGKLTQADEHRFQGEDVRARSFKGEAFAKELAKAEKLRFLVHGPVRTLGQAALAFCLAHPAVSVTIPGARNEQQMRENASAGDLELPQEDLERVRELWRRGFDL